MPASINATSPTRGRGFFYCEGKMLTIIATTIATIIALISSFIAGWLTAGEKIRHEFYKRKIEAYDAIIDSLYTLVTVTIALRTLEGEPSLLENTKMEFFITRAKNSIFLSKEVLESIVNLKMDSMDPGKIIQGFNETIKLSAKDLRVKHYNEITSITTLSTEDIRVLLRKLQQLT